MVATAAFLPLPKPADLCKFSSGFIEKCFLVSEEPNLILFLFWMSIGSGYLDSTGLECWPTLNALEATVTVGIFDGET